VILCLLLQVIRGELVHMLQSDVYNTPRSIEMWQLASDKNSHHILTSLNCVNGEFLHGQNRVRFPSDLESVHTLPSKSREQLKPVWAVNECSIFLPPRGQTGIMFLICATAGCVVHMYIFQNLYLLKYNFFQFVTKLVKVHKSGSAVDASPGSYWIETYVSVA